MKRLLLLLCLLPSWCSVGQAAHLHPEKTYQKSWCAAVRGETEHVLPDDTRVDCLTEEYAIEFDFCQKWAEAIGQALYYAIRTGRKPGIVLILEDESDRCVGRLEVVARRAGIRIWLLRSYVAGTRPGAESIPNLQALSTETRKDQ